MRAWGALRALLVGSALALLLAGCVGGEDAPAAAAGGGVAATLQWPDQAGVAAAPLGTSLPFAAPPGVTEIRATVDGPDFEPIVRTFTAGAGSGTVNGVPVGSGRSLDVEALDAGGTALYGGSAIGITITAGTTTSVPVALTLLSTTPPPVPTITSPTGNPHYSITTTVQIDGVCSGTNTVDLAGDEVDSIACSGGVYSFSFVEAADATYQYEVTQTSVTLLQSAADTVTWVIDQVRPADIVLAPASATTSGNSYNITGACETGATVNLTGDDTQSTACVGSAFSFTVAETVDATYNYSLAQTDPAGNTSLNPGPFAWTRNSAVPASPVITSPASSPNYSQTLAAISGTCIDGYDVYLTDVTGSGTDDAMVVCAGSAFAFNTITDPGADSPPARVYTVNQDDGAGGPSSGDASLSWFRDTTPPIAPSITQPATDPVVTTGATITIAGACETGATVNLTGDDTQNTTCVSAAYSFSVTEPDDGTYSYSVTQTDLALNLSPASTQGWIREAVPGTPLIDQASPLLANTPPTLTGNCITGYTVSLGGAETGPTDTCAGGTYSIGPLSDQASDGDYDYTVTQTSPSMVSSAAAGLTWTRDTVALTPTITTPASDPFASGTNSLSVNGACETGATVNLTGDDTQNTTCAGSAYSFTINEASAGTYNYSITQTDLAGNVSGAETQQWQLTLPAAPVITSPTSPHTSQGPPTLNGTCINGHTVELDGDETVTVGVCSGSAFAVTLTDQAGDGTYNYTVRQWIVPGGLSPPANFAWVRDTAAPATPTITTPASDPFSSSDPSLTISGACETGATVNLTGDETDSDTCVGSAYSFAVSESATGTFNYSVTQTDLAGNTSGAEAQQFTVTVPAAPVISAPTSPHTSQGPPTLTGSCTTGYTVELGGDETGVTNTCAGSVFSLGLSDQASDGTYNYTVVQWILSGADSLPDSFQWVRDTTAPSPPTVTNPATSPFTSSDPTLDIDGACETDATVNLTGDDTQSTTCASSAYSFTITESTEATFTYSITQTDAANNTSSPPTTQQWQRALPPAAPVITAPTSPHTSQGPPVLTGSCINGHTVELGGDETGPTDTCAGSAFSLTLLDQASDGTYNYTVRQWVVAGILSPPANFVWTRDTIALAPTITQPAANPSFSSATMLTIGGACETGATVNLTGDDTQSTACGGGLYSFDVTETAEGVYNYAITQTDLAGNTSAAANQQWQRFLPGFIVDPTSLSGSEGGAPQSFTIMLETPPNGNVVVDLASSDTTEATVSPNSVTLNAGNWVTGVSVDVTPEADGIPDGNRTATIITTVNGGSTTDTTGYAALNPDNVTMQVTDVDSVSVTVAPQSGLLTTEAGGTAMFSVVLNSRPTNVVMIDVTSLDTTEVTVNPSPLTFTCADPPACTGSDFDTPQAITVTGVDDAITDGSILVTIAVTMNPGTLDAAYGALDPPDVTVTNSDDEAPNIAVAPTTGLAVTESGGTDTFSVALGVVPDGNVVIDVVSQDITEVSVNKSKLTFTTSDWFTPQIVTLTGLDDPESAGLIDGNQNVTIALTINSGETTDTTGYAALNPVDPQVLNSDEDTAGFTVIPTAMVTNEDGLAATFKVSLNTRPSAGMVVVIDVASSDATEVSVAPTSLTFTEDDWSTPQIVTVTGIDDPESAGLIDGTQVAVVVLSVNTIGTTECAYRFSGPPCAAGSPLNPPDVSVTNSDTDAPGATVTPTLLTVSESGTSATFSVRLNTQPSALPDKVEFLVQSQDTGEATVDKAVLTFTEDDWQTPQIVTVTGVPDGTADGNQTFKIAIITDTAETTDDTYDAVNPVDVTVITTDNTPELSITPTTGLTISEAGGTANFTVRLNTQPQAASTVVIDLTSSDVAELTVDVAQLTFSEFDWATPRTVTVTGVDDGAADGTLNETIDLVINGATTDTDYASLGPWVVDVTISDDEVKDVIVSPVAGLVTDESGSTDSFNVSLSALPTGNVVIDVVSNDTNEVTVDKASLTFTIADWSNPQTVTVRGVNDTATDGDAVVAILLTIDTGLTADTDYDAVDPADPQVTNLDNEAASEGTIPMPINITGAVPHAGQVASSTTSNSYYVVNGLDPLKTYYVGVSSLTSPVTVLLHNEGTFAVADCTGNQWAATSGRPRHCTLMPNGSGDLFIEVVSNSTTAGANFQLSVTEPLPANEGASGTGNQVALTVGSLPYEGQVGDFDAAPASSYYEVTGLTANVDQLVRITNFTDAADLFVYSDADFTALLCSSAVSGIAESCVADMTGITTLYIRVDAEQNPDGHDGAFFTLDIVDVPVSEGTPGTPPTPLDVTGQLPHSGSLDSTNDSFYVLTGLTPSSPFTVSITNVTGGGTLEVYVDSDYSDATGVTCTPGPQNRADICQANANPSGKLFITVTTADVQPGGSTYDLRVQ